MYYYIFDPPQGSKEYERTAQIKELLASLGIAGEMASPLPGRSIEDLVDQAIAKRYSTVIAVGGVNLINKIACGLISHDAVMGVIPLVEHPDITRLLGTSDWKSAANQLKRRRWHETPLGVLNNGSCFITSARISFSQEQEYSIVTPRFSLQCQGGEVAISPYFAKEGKHHGLELEISPQEEKKSFWSRFQIAPNKPLLTRLQAETIQLETSSPQDIIVAGSVVATTPISCATHPKALKLIMGKEQPI